MKQKQPNLMPAQAISASERHMRPRLSLRWRETLWFHVLVAPWLLGFLIFTLFPTVASLYLSFTNYNAIRTPNWTGLANFQSLFGDRVFWQSLKVTLVYAVVAVPLQLATALLLAMLLNQRIPAMAFFRTMYYLPSVMPTVVVSLLWVWLLNPSFGLVNYILYITTGIRGPNWLGSETWVMPAVILSSLWGIGNGIVIFLAGLQSVPKELHEAAEIDGASMARRFFSVTLPLITPVLFYNLLIGMIGAFQTFTRIYVLTGGGPNYASYFYNLYLYENAFSYFKLGLASAQAWILFTIILLLTLVMLRTSGRWVYYAGG